MADTGAWDGTEKPIVVIIRMWGLGRMVSSGDEAAMGAAEELKVGESGVAFVAGRRWRRWGFGEGGEEEGVGIMKFVCGLGISWGNNGR
ncbi:hypothetical protein Csa_019632 [Cucumis sativus]|uniref:Uncharacterized protein n=1 Tax=Cucumis sativus TaxID=3659 RepID=A0A0A0LUK7_CUCSA|nr:hypothetical protein Csa_019632 [Cucumis sativus]